MSERSDSMFGCTPGKPILVGNAVTIVSISRVNATWSTPWISETYVADLVDVDPITKVDLP